MKKIGILGIMGAFLAQSNNSNPYLITRPAEPQKPTAKNKPSKGRWRTSKPSDYFGRRSEIVTAETPKGSQKMKLKTALKKDFKFNF